MGQEKIKDVYIKLLLAAGIMFIIGITYILSDLYWKIGELEHGMMHLKGTKKASFCGH